MVVGIAAGHTYIVMAGPRVRSPRFLHRHGGACPGHQERHPATTDGRA
jgi:hypothetical protein